jgi:glucose-1-phosphate thymidylyltransferase
MVPIIIIGEKFIGTDRVCLILGDNIFYGYSFSKMLKSAILKKKGATLFAYHVTDPKRFGVVEFDKNKKVMSIKEKPKNPKSNYAITGLYFYDNRVIKIAKSLKPSLRGELEITDINNTYLKWDDLNVEIMGRGFSWLDTGTHETLMTAGHFVQAIEESQGLKIGCLEEIAFNNGWLDSEIIKKKCKLLSKTSYGQYLLRTID